MILSWDRTKPFTIDMILGSSHIDGYGHVSNHFYISWITDCMFSHSEDVGLSEKIRVEMNRGMAVLILSQRLYSFQMQRIQPVWGLCIENHLAQCLSSDT